MSFAAQTVLKPMSMASNGCLISCPSLFTASKISSSYPSLSVPFKPINFQLSCKKISSHSLPASFPLKRKETLLRFCVVAAQEEGSPVILEEREEDEEGFGVSNDWEESEGAETDGYVEPPEGAKVFVGNLPFDVDSERLAMLFQNAGVVEAAEVIYDRDTNQSRGFGFVTMSSEEEAQKAVEMFQSYDLGGRLLFANIATPKRSRTERSERPERVQRGSGASTNKLYVGNLSWNVDSQRLEQVFSEHGRVVSARVVSDMESGRSRGFGFVEMSSESEMNDAIANLDGQSLDGRAIKVNTATERPRRSRY